jgi:membrane associated rhomboid family serine protease
MVFGIAVAIAAAVVGLVVGVVLLASRRRKG